MTATLPLPERLPRLFRLIYEALRSHRSDIDAMQEQIAALKGSVDNLELAAASARQREAAHKSAAVSLQEQLTQAQQQASLSADGLAVVHDLQAKVEALTASLNTPA